MKNFTWLEIDWLKNQTKEDSAQAKLLADVPEDKRFVISHTQKNGRLYAIVSFDEMKKKLCKKNRGIFEIITTDHKRKVYFDIDSYDYDPLIEVKQIILDKFEDATMQISGSIEKDEKSERTKYSYHIILSNYYFINYEDQNLIKLWVLRQDDKLGFDASVYSKNQLMKCINQSKSHSSRVQNYISGSKDISKHFILFDFDEDEKNAYDLFDFEPIDVDNITQETSLLKLDLSTIQQQNNIVPDEFNWYEAEAQQILGLIPYDVDRTIRYYVMCWCKTQELSFETYWNWTKQKNDSVLRRNKHYGDYKYCYMVGNNTIGLILERFYPKILMDKYPKQFEKQNNVKPDLLIESKYLRVEDFKNRLEKYIMLNNPMGSGKTKSIIDYLQLQKDKSMLWISPRISLTTNILPVYRLKKNGLEFVSTQDFKSRQERAEKIPFTTKLIMCAQSLHYIDSSLYDIVIIDEVETVLNAWVGNETHKNLELNFMNFKDTIKNSKKVFLMDAFMTTKTYNLFENIEKSKKKNVFLGQPEQFYTINSIQKPDKRQFSTYKNKETWINNIVEKVNENKKIFIFYPYKRSSNAQTGMDEFAYGLQKLANKKINILTYHGDTDDAKKRTLGDVENTWAKADVVICNTSITVGVNFDIEHFDYIFALYVNWVSLRDFFQNLYRVRTPKIKTIHLLTKSAYNSFGFKYDNINDNIYDNLVNDVKIERLANNSKETFNMYMRYANITYSDSIKSIGLKYQKELKKKLEGSLCYYSWESIKDYEGDIDDLTKKINACDATMNEKLMVEKHWFRNLFETEVDETKLAIIWNEKYVDCVRGINYLKKHPNDLIWSIFKENKCKDTFNIPSEATWNTNLEQLKKQYKIKIRYGFASHKRQLIRGVVSIFFGKDIYKPPQKTKREKGNRRVYNTDPQFTETFELCQKYGKLFQDDNFVEDIQEETDISLINEL